VFRDLLTEKGEPLGGLSPAATKRGKTGEFGGGWLASRGQAAVGWAMARNVLFICVHSRAKWAMAGACTRVRSVLYVGRARARCSGAGAGEAGNGRRQREGDTELRGLSLALV
jgi:hypothetical protein